MVVVANKRGQVGWMEGGVGVGAVAAVVGGGVLVIVDKRGGCGWTGGGVSAVGGHRCVVIVGWGG